MWLQILLVTILSSATRQLVDAGNDWVAISVHKQHHCTAQYERSSSHLFVHCPPRFPRRNLRGIFRKYPRTLQLTITNSHLKHIPKDLCIMKHLQSVFLSHNNITTIDRDRLICLRGLQVLHLDNNQITRIEETTFVGFSNMTTLNLHYNRISFLHPKALWHPSLKMLQTIILSYNLIERVDISNAFRLPFLPKTVNPGIPQMHLNLSKNNIYVIDNNYNFSITEIQYHSSIIIDMRNNQFRHLGNIDPVRILKLKHLWDYFRTWDMAFYFMENPWDCDCGMYKFKKFFGPIIKIFKKKSMHDLRFIKWHCVTPPEANARLWYEVPENIFRCGISKNCPKNCSCIRHPGNGTIIVDCHGVSMTSLPDKLPYVDKHVINARFSKTNIKTVDNRPYLKNTTLLDLSFTNLIDHGSIKNESVKGWSNIQVILLNDNQLHYLPKALDNVTFTNLTYVNIQNNPFYCDCHSRWLKHWLLRQKDAVQNLDNVRCYHPKELGKSSIVSVANADFGCGPFITSLFSQYILLIVVACIQFSFLIALGIVQKCKRKLLMKHLKHFRGKLLLNLLLNQTELETFKNDVYVDHDPDLNHNLRAEIDSLRTRMETEHKLTVFSCQDDILGYEPELKRMQEEIKTSRILILFVTEKYAHDKRFRQAFIMAFDQCWPNDERKLILVFPETIINIKNSDLKCYIESVPELCFRNDWKTELLDEVINVITMSS